MRERKLKYLLCKEQILSIISNGGISPGELIPPIKELEKTLGQSRTSIQRAISELAAEGILESKIGSGCYLRKSPPPLSVKTVKNGRNSSVENYLLSPGMRSSPSTLKFGILLELNDYAGVWHKVINDYNQSKDGLAVEAMHIPSYESLLELGSNLNLPDIFQIPNYLLPEVAKNGMSCPLEETGCRIELDNFFPGCRKGAIYDGKAWGVPVSCACSCMLADSSREDFIDAISAAKNFDGFMAALRECKGLLASSGYEAVTLNCYNLFNYFQLAGLTPSESFLDFIKLLASSLARDFLEEFEPFFRDGLIFSGRRTAIFSASSAMFARKATPTVLGHTAMMGRTLKDCLFPVKMLPLPQNAQGRNECITFLNLVSSFTEIPDECAEFMQYLGSSEVQGHFASQGRVVSNRKAMERLSLAGPVAGNEATLISILEKSGTVTMNSTAELKFARSVLLKSSDMWQEGAWSVDEMLDNIANKAYACHILESQVRSC